MPCSDGGWPGSTQTIKVDNPKHMAVVCGLLTAHGPGILDRVDWAEVGVTRAWVERWWQQHKKIDEERRARERADRAANAKKQRIAAQIAAKLTPEEQAFVGLPNKKRK